MSKEFATRNLVHNKIPEFPSGSGADRFLTKKRNLRYFSICKNRRKLFRCCYSYYG